MESLHQISPRNIWWRKFADFLFSVLSLFVLFEFGLGVCNSRSLLSNLSPRMYSQANYYSANAWTAAVAKNRPNQDRRKMGQWVNWILPTPALLAFTQGSIRVLTLCGIYIILYGNCVILYGSCAILHGSYITPHGKKFSGWGWVDVDTQLKRKEGSCPLCGPCSVVPQCVALALLVQCPFLRTSPQRERQIHSS